MGKSRGLKTKVPKRPSLCGIKEKRTPLILDLRSSFEPLFLQTYILLSISFVGMAKTTTISLERRILEKSFSGYFNMGVCIKIVKMIVVVYGNRQRTLYNEI